MINYLCYYYNIPYLLIILTINYHWYLINFHIKLIEFMFYSVLNALSTNIYLKKKNIIFQSQKDII